MQTRSVIKDDELTLVSVTNSSGEPPNKKATKEDVRLAGLPTLKQNGQRASPLKHVGFTAQQQLEQSFTILKANHFNADYLKPKAAIDRHIEYFLGELKMMLVNTMIF